MGTSSTITCFEYDKVLLSDLKNSFGEKRGLSILKSLHRNFGTRGSNYYSLIHNGIQFGSYVGVIQVGNIFIEVLPKIDKVNSENDSWRNVLLSMLRFVQGLEAEVTSTSTLNVQSNALFDLYIELFVKECEKITHRGLIKKYRRVNENKNALKGKLDIPKQIRNNYIHKERFYVEYNTYDQNHLLNQILKTVLETLKTFKIRQDLESRVRKLALYFESIPVVNVTDSTFRDLIFNRKTELYRQGIQIAKLILLNYHPGIRKGSHDVFALMFDMNKLWEQFITKMMKRHLSDRYDVKSQSNKIFWNSSSSRKRLKPDILLIPKNNKDNKIVIDTKWKTPSKLHPSDNDLRQIFAYNRLFDSKNGILLYPGMDQFTIGRFETDHGGTCAMQNINVLDDSGNLITSNKLLQSFVEN